MSTYERSSLSHVSKIVADRHELTARIHAAEQLGSFLFAALRTLGKKHSTEDPYIELILPLIGQQDWAFAVEAEAQRIESGDEETPINVNFWNMADNTEVPGYYNEAVSRITVKRNLSTCWAAVLGGANVEKPECGYHYEDNPDDYEWPSTEVVALTHDIVDAVKRYERQNGITAPLA